MNPAPAATSDVAVMRKSYLEKLGAHMQRQREIVNGAAYQAGEPDAVTARHRIHFKVALQRPADYEKLMSAMHSAFLQQGNDGIVKARAVEDRLMLDTWGLDTYNLLPKLEALRVPTLVITGDHDFIPVEVAAHIATAIPNAKLMTIRDCGHFAYLECARETRVAIDAFFRSTKATQPRR